MEMEMFETIVVVVHVLVSLGLIGLIMIQQGKGAEAGASFGGGASQTVFGSQGSGNFLTKTTKYLAIIFFATSISLAVIAKQRSEVSSQELLPTAAIAEEIKNPSKNLPLSMLASLALITAIYVVVSFVLVSNIPVSELATDIKPIFTLADKL